MTNFVDVAIVGAGASGLKLACLLTRAGVDVVVFEGRDRIGGRLQLVEPGVDLGATWFWKHEHEVLEVISEFGLKTFPQHIAGNMMFQIPGNVQELEGNPLDQQAWRIVGGMQSLTSALEQDLPDGILRMSTSVTGLKFEDKVMVTTDNGDWIAKHVVLALPPATALTNITFTPELPQDLIGIAEQTPVWMGAITKVVAIYDSPFWRSKGLAGSAMSHVGPLREIHDVSDEGATFGALFGFSRGEVLESEVLEQLSQLFGPEAGSPRQLIFKDWSTSKFTSPPEVFELNDYQLFGSPLLRTSHFEGKLYFSSTETAIDSPGHVQGAFSAARRTADALLSHLSEPSLRSSQIPDGARLNL